MRDLTEFSAEVNSYKLLSETKNGTTGIYPQWGENDKQFKSMMEFQTLVLRYVKTKSNNQNKTLKNYIRCMYILRDFSRRFMKVHRKFKDWRMFAQLSGEHFAHCMYFVKDCVLFDNARKCINIIVRNPYTVASRTFNDVDDFTSYKMSYPWIVAKLAVDRKNYAWGNNNAYRQSIHSIRDRTANYLHVKRSAMRKLNSFYGEYDDGEVVTKTDFVILRDHGRLWRGKIPFYGDNWLKYIYSDKLRKFEENLNKGKKPSSIILSKFEQRALQLIVHKQVKYTGLGLIDSGYSVSSYWELPASSSEATCIPSIGFLRMYNQQWAFSCQQIKANLPFYTYRAGHFNQIHMHAFSQCRFFATAKIDEGGGDNGSDGGNNRRIYDDNDRDKDKWTEKFFAPGSIVLDNESESWVLNNCRVRYSNNGTIVSLYPIKARGTVAASKKMGMMVQEYEMFSGLTIVEYLLLDFINRALFSYIEVDNKTGRTCRYYTSFGQDGSVIPFKEKGIITVEAKDSDEFLKSTSLCNPQDVDAFFAKGQVPVKFSRFFADCKINYVFDLDDPPYHISILSFDEMINVPEQMTVNEVKYKFDEEYNQYVKRSTIKAQSYADLNYSYFGEIYAGSYKK